MHGARILALALAPIKARLTRASLSGAGCIALASLSSPNRPASRPQLALGCPVFRGCAEPFAVCNSWAPVDSNRRPTDYECAQAFAAVCGCSLFGSDVPHSGVGASVRLRLPPGVGWPQDGPKRGDRVTLRTPRARRSPDGRRVCGPGCSFSRKAQHSADPTGDAQGPRRPPRCRVGEQKFVETEPTLRSHATTKASKQCSETMLWRYPHSH